MKGIGQIVSLCIVYMGIYNNKKLIFRVATAIEAKGLLTDSWPHAYLSQADVIFQIMKNINYYKITHRVFSRY